MQTRPYRPVRKTALARRAIPDWAKLARNDAVTVVGPNGTTATGRIDMIAIDRSVFWLLQDNRLGRLMVCATDKYWVSRDPNRTE